MSSWLDNLKDKLDPIVFETAFKKIESGDDAADFLVKNKYLTGIEMLKCLSEYYDVPSIILSQYEIEEEAIVKLPEDISRRFKVMPLFVLKDKIYVATSDPHNVDVEDFVYQQTGLVMEEIVTTTFNIEQALNKYYLEANRNAEKVKSIYAEKMEKLEEKDKFEEELKLEDSDSPSIKLVNHIISSAIRLKASDIHLEPFENSVSLRYRIDGVLKEYSSPPLDMLKAVTSRIKIISDLDVSEKRLPQDGRTTFELENQNFDLRISIIPNIFGESVVIRILDTGKERKDLTDLGFSRNMMDQYLKMITKPYGMFLVTGPTGSGKTTTLYATLRHVLTPEKKIISLEDPVEAKIKGITQMQMHSQIGFTFPNALRSVLRHDPEIILIGEVRDLETAEISIRAALTGHLLFSTLHTNDAPSTLTRLIDMGLPGYLIMSSLIGVLAQRLVRILCNKCKQKYEPDENILKTLNIKEIPKNATLFSPVGCANCENTGYRGRVAIYELMEVSQEMKQLKDSELNSSRITEIAKKDNYINLKDSVLEKWFMGITSLEEVFKISIE